MNLPLVNVFTKVYIQYNYQEIPFEKRLSHFIDTKKMIRRARSGICFTISNPYTAAMHMCNVGADNGLAGHIEDSLEYDVNFKKMLSLMPNPMPQIFSDYKVTPKAVNSKELNKAILEIGMRLSTHQYLYHGGIWGENNKSIITQRPLSTSFCPQVAMRNAEHNDKAFNAGRIDLLVLMVVKPITPVFVYQEIYDTVNEKEVLFASGARLKKRWEHKISEKYEVSSINGQTKKISTYVVMVEIS